MIQKLKIPFQTNLKPIIDREKYRFIKSILEGYELDLDFWKSDILGVDERLFLNKLLESNNFVISDDNYFVYIYLNSKEVGKMKYPTFVCVKDVTNKNQIELEMSIELTSIFDQPVEIVSPKKKQSSKSKKAK